MSASSARPVSGSKGSSAGPVSQRRKPPRGLLVLAAGKALRLTFCRPAPTRPRGCLRYIASPFPVNLPRKAVDPPRKEYSCTSNKSGSFRYTATKVGLDTACADPQAEVLHRCVGGEHVGRLRSRCGNEIHHVRPADRQGAGLVEHHHGQPPRRVHIVRPLGGSIHLRQIGLVAKRRSPWARPLTGGP